MVGRTLGHYRILDELGKGGMGEVYLAEDQKLEREVALKVLPAEMASSSERLDRFEREAKAVAALNHPNIVHVHSVEEAEGLHFFTMELVEGESLSELIPAEGLPLKQFFELAIPLAEALSEAHGHGIVHRDLKPANVMVDRKGRPKILDFGLAKLVPSGPVPVATEAPTEILTQPGVVLGTYPYMSPEQAEGKEANHRSDLFSLGIVFYEMVTGARPFKGASPASLIGAILKDDPRPIFELRSDLPRDLQLILDRCLEKHPSARYANAEDLSAALEDLRQATVAGVSAPVSAKLPAFLLGEDPAVPRIQSLAVLPLENLSGDSELDYYAAGITEGLIGELGRVSALRVISRRSVVRYHGSEMPLPEIAAELGVEALIEGSVLPVGDRVRVTAQLVQAEPEQLLWAETYERDAKDILTLLRKVTGVIVSEIQVALSPGEQARQAVVREVDPEAHRIYFKALQVGSIGTPESSMNAREYLREAVAIDPGFAEAWVALASHSCMLAVLHLPANMESERAAAIEELNVALEKALALDDSSSLAHSVQGIVHAQLDWDWARAEQEHLRAIELNASSPDAHSAYAGLLAALGRFEESFVEAAMAEELDPFSADVLREIGAIHYWAHDYPRSLQYLDQAQELAPGSIYNQSIKGWVFGAAGREKEAVRSWQKMQGMLGNYFLAAAFEGRSLAEVNRAWLDFVLGMDRPFFGAADIATAYVMLGQNDEATEWLEKGFASRDNPGKTAGWRFIYLKVDPNFDDLHGDRRFQDLLRRMNLAD